MKIEKDKVVSINYVLTDSDKKEIDSSNETGPLKYVHGNGYLIKGLEEQLEGKQVGEKFTAFVKAVDAYGEYDKALVVEVPRDQFDSSVEIEVGMQFQASSPVGPTIVTVKKIENDKITIDANHELAGKDLTFDVEVVEVRDMTEEEAKQLEEGCCGGGCGGCGGDCDGNCDGDCSSECNGNCDCKND